MIKSSSCRSVRRCSILTPTCMLVWVARFGQEVLVGYSEPIFPGDHGDFEAYVAHIQREWDAQWKRVYTADWSGREHPLAHAGASLSCCTVGEASFHQELGTDRSVPGFW